ncbi:MAG: trehalose-phosphatase [Chloroflexi bacterium HGW-Chloroflexi-3]|nr:MAG: trehalose-phosphatase [Chloroflexi bacterium HGW-Chloroflexi-3]
MKDSPSLQQLMKIYQKERAFLFLDYDGTLARFAPNPDVVLPDSELIDILHEINKLESIRLAIISGRRLDHIRSLVPINGIWLSGSYGLEMIDPSGNELHLLEFDHLRLGLEIIKPTWQALIDRRDGFYLEDKGWSLAIHANGSDKHEVNLVLENARRIDVPDGFHMKYTHNFIELCPPKADKGVSVDYILNSESFEGALPIFIGDDPRDEDAFAAVQSIGGVGIIVVEKDRDTKATYTLKRPEQVRDWLKEIK